MSGNATGYVDFDTGLAELARHARDRGKRRARSSSSTS